MNLVFEDAEKGDYFLETQDDKSTKKVVRKVRPEDLGFVKKIETTIIVKKKISNAEGLTDEEVYFELPITFQFPQDEPRSGNTHTFSSVEVMRLY